MSKNAHYSFDPIIVPGIILQQRLPIFFFFNLELNLCRKKKRKEKMEKTQIRGADRLWSWVTTGL